MKKFILFLLFFAAKNVISQNGLTTYSTALSSSISPGSENAFFIDNAGNKWVGFSNSSSNSPAAFGVYTNSTSAWTFWNKTITPILQFNNARCFAQDNSGNILIGTSYGLLKYDGSNFTLYTTANGLANNFIYSLEYSNNMLYIGTNGVLSRFDGTTFTNYVLPINPIWNIKAETPNILWLTGGNKLVKFYINSSFTSTLCTTYTSSISGLYGIYIDPSGNKWVGSGSAIVKYDNLNFTYYKTEDFVGFSDIGQNSLAKGPNNGVLFIGTYNNSNTVNCLVELLPTGDYKLYNFPDNILFSNNAIGGYLAREPSGKIFMTGAVTSSTLNQIVRMHSFDYSNYSVTGAFDLGAGSGVNKDNFKYLDINRVKAGILNRGDMWWEAGGNGNTSYEVPKGIGPYGGSHSAFAASLWIGGLDASNQLHTAGQTYRQTGNDFWPGPLDTTNAFIDTNTAINYDKIWKVSDVDINTFLYQFSLGNVPLTYTPTADILSWPAKGTGNKSRNLAPFVDVNNNGVYDPLVGGDYPKIKGDQTLYFIFNDNLSSHRQTGGLPFGIEVHTMAYAFGCPSVLNGRNELAYTTFYDYKIYNRSNTNYHAVNIGFKNDVDLGNYGDDYIGSSIYENLGFCYNADDNDEVMAGGTGYDQFPPAVGTTVLKGPLAPLNDLIDNDNDSIIDEPGEECLMNVFNYYNNGSGPTGDPITKYHYYNLLQGKWRDSTNFTCGGNGYGFVTPTKFVYPWSNHITNPCGTWTELSAGNIPSDRRYLVSSGPFNLPAKGNIEVEYAYVWSVDSSATSNIAIASVNKLISDTRKIRSFYKSGAPSCVGKAIGIQENEWKDQLTIYPNPANSILNIRSENYLGKSVVSITDILGKTIMETKTNDLYQTSINIEHLNSSVYFLNINSEKGSIVKKFVKQ